MKIVVDMPWEKELSVNHMRFGARGGYRRKPHVQAWMGRLGYEVYAANWHLDLGHKTPLSVIVDFRFPNARTHDDHNLYKVIADAVAAGLHIDDKDIRISTRSVTVDRERPGFTITVSDEETG